MRKLPVVALFTVCTCFNWAQSVSPQVQPFIKVNAPVVALTHVRVIAGTGEAALEDQTIVISKGKIQHVNRAYQQGDEPQYQALFDTLTQIR